MGANTNGSPIGDYRARLDGFKRFDAERVALIDELVSQLENSEDDRRKISYDLDSEKNERRRLQQVVDELRGDLVAIKNRRSFVLVLIDADADCYMFQERFLNEGEKGGKDAADEILARVKDYLKSIKTYSDDMDVVVRAYANLKDLAQAYVRLGKMRHAANLGLFAVGFTKRQALFDFVDVGVGKERADNKIRDTLNFYIGNGQCKHVILGCSHDSGYAPALEKFAADNSTRERITLLKGGPIHPQIASLGFTKTLTLRTVFGSQDVKSLKVTSDVAPASGSTIISLGVAPNGSVSPSLDASGSVPKHLNLAVNVGRLGPVLRNDAGQRVDRHLAVDANAQYFHVLKKANLCHWYYLRGECTGCKKNHFVGPLSPYEYDCLWYLARNAVCWKVQRGKDCDDPKCIYGHRKQS